MTATITRGFVMVETPERDCEGTARTIDFPYVGKCLYGTPLFHWTVEKYVNRAHDAAVKALLERN